ncbi:heme-binding domain-containing protein [Chryseobacterium caseinilyticum]|uniref:Heme-binding domain-containing protein n=1 Tax=Chryseobacterium caseinilyticum TaxID=2771428 RepID=A0ABR8ZE87_9FLAO|nr:heme-binding domain-containing protein [Chryseobacterium caseinilyticum]MBD8083619.1 heme-binding domain-containing protein [Chryseobacterium caseinilyticum]
MKTAKKVFFWVLVGFALIQFIPVDKVNKPVDQKLNFVTTENTPAEVAVLIKNACYDCHSDETVYPKYAQIAPISWSIKSHVNDGRRHLNFSVWKSYNADLKKSMLEKSVQTIQNKTMPLPGYSVYHDEANLTAAQQKILTDYFESVLKAGKF